MTAGDSGLEEEKSIANAPDEDSQRPTADMFNTLIKDVLGNYMEERVCEHAVSFNYAKYSEEQIKYKSTTTYEGAAARFEADKANCKKDMTKYEGITT